MALTLKEWEDHFKTLSIERKRELYKAITIIEDDPVFRDQYAWTGIFTLGISIMSTEPELWEEYNKKYYEKEDRKYGKK